MRAGEPRAAMRDQALGRRDIRMIEDAFRKEHYFQSLTELGKSLPRKVERENLRAAIAYIEGSNKIVGNRDGSLAWAYTESRAARKSLKESTPLL